MKKLLLPLALIATGLVGLLVFGILAGAVPEIQARQLHDVAGDGREVRMHGILEKIVSNDRPLRFLVRDKDRPTCVVPVFADKTRPDTFQESFDIAVDGSWDAARNEFVATRILTKCPSKYEAESKQGYNSREAWEKAQEEKEKAPAGEGPGVAPK